MYSTGAKRERERERETETETETDRERKGKKRERRREREKRVGKPKIPRVQYPSLDQQGSASKKSIL